MNTMQQEFDAVVAHLYKQGKPAKSDGDCLYRADDGLMCAVGCRIPDEMYSTDMEGTDLDGIVQFAKDGFYKLPPEITEYQTMFSALQSVHDEWVADGSGDDMEYLHSELAFVADEFGLTFTVPR